MNTKLFIKQMKRNIFRSHRSAFIIGLAIGVILAILLHSYNEQYPKTILKNQPNPIKPYDFAYEKWIQKRGMKSIRLDPDQLRYNTSHTDENSLNPNTEAFELFKEISIACFIIPETPQLAYAIRETWGRHCSKLYFFSNKLQNETIPIVQLKDTKSEFHLICDSFRKIYEAQENFQWILITNERTFSILENLRYYVAAMNSSHPYYLGHAMKFWGEIYNWESAGYVISRGALEKFIQKFPDSKKCQSGGKYWNNGDWYVGKNLAQLGIVPRDTRDHLGRSRFNGYNFKKLLFPGAVSIFDRYWRDSLYLSNDGPHCCSHFAITFNGVLSESKMYQLEYMFQHLRAFFAGGNYGNHPPKNHVPKNSFLTWEEQMKDEALEKLFKGDLFQPKPEHDLS